MRVPSLKTLVLICALPLSAWAGEHANKCKGHGEDAQKACDAAIQGAGAADAAQASKNIAGVGSRQTINPAGGTLQGQISDQMGRLNQAKSQCQAAKSQCESQCANEKSQADMKRQQELQKMQQGIPPDQAKLKDPGETDQAKQSACIAPLLAKMGQLDSALGNLAKDAQGTGNTQNASQGGGMPPMMPPPQGGGEDSGEDEEKQADNVEPKLDCSKAGTDKYSDCNSDYIALCEGNFGNAGCDSFVSRYCNLSSTPPTSADQPYTAPGNDQVIVQFSTTQQLVADKKGEGMGSDFCKKANAYRYCQTSGRSHCPSCQNLSSTSSPDILKQAQNSCPTDPMFLDPQVQAQLNSESTPSTSLSTQSLDGSNSDFKDRVGQSAGGSPGAGGGGGLGGGAAGAGGAATGAAVSEGSLGGTNFGGGSGSGGGGGGFSYGEGSSGGGDSSDSSNAATTGPGFQPSSVRSPASAARDVANQYGPSIFAISSTTIRALCQKNRLNNCN